jgi:putative PIN family toxin of toxin-antitoxin system
MTDTNILFSALILPMSLPAKVLFYIVAHHTLILCDYIISELKDVVSRKRPDLLSEIDIFLARLSYELVIAPRDTNKLISDPKDHPIMNAAIMANVDIIISGDKHFLAVDIERPKTIKAAQFWEDLTETLEISQC